MDLEIQTLTNLIEIVVVTNDNKSISRINSIHHTRYNDAKITRKDPERCNQR